MKNKNHPFNSVNLDRIMNFLYRIIITTSTFIVNSITSPPRRLKYLLKEFKDSITRLFKFSISFKIAVLSSFKILRKLFVLNLVLIIIFCVYNLYIIRDDFKEKENYLRSSFSSGDPTELELIQLKEQFKYERIDGQIIKNDIRIFDTTIYNTGSTSIPDDKTSHVDTLINGTVYYIDNLNIYFSLNGNTQNFMIYSSHFKLNGRNYEIYLVKNLVALEDILFKLTIVLIILSLLFLKSCLKYISKISKKMLVPVYVMNDAIKDINISNLDTRLNVKGSKDELKDLAVTVNNMFDRIHESYNKQKQFVSDASHELRTPIAVIQGYASLLGRWGKDDREVLEESIEAIKDESDNMKELVEKLLFLARADKNSQKIEKSEFNLSDLIDNICKESNMIDSMHNITCNTEDNLMVFADEKLLKQSIRVLIDNGIKYTPAEGYINISAFSVGNDIVIRVADSGVGIPADAIPHIFDRFYRVDESRSKQEDKGGTGLGLSIANWIVSIHGGTLSVESMVDKGSVFTIKIPFSQNS